MNPNLYLYILLVVLPISTFIFGRYLEKQSSKNNQIREEEKNRFLAQQLEQASQNAQQLKQDNALEKIAMEEQRQLISQDNQELIARVAIRDTEYHNALERLKNQKVETEQLRQQFTLEFEHLATKILEEKSQKFTAQNKENIQNILTPLQERIQNFEKKVENTHKESIDHHASLRQQIIGLQQLHLQMSQETLNLTKALKGDSKMQGNWGEMILERVLEKSGLEKGREYEVQKSHYNGDGNLVYPDVIIHLPDNKKMIVDSKVSLTAYERFINEDTEMERKRYLNEHLLSIKKHIDQLSSKNYSDLYQLESPDFVLMFIPIETAFSQALNYEPQLYTMAYDKNIVIVTPSTLLATLRTIDSMWKHQKQQENAYEIARQAGLLYDKFEGLLSDLNRIGKKMEDAKIDYQLAMNKLVDGRGNLISSVEKLKKMGAKTKKSLPENFLRQSENTIDSVD
ncbi:DNA recombination protein RmuC [Flavobacterium sp. NKUCC04_CG]|nr:DNA recombination protein RmuC [Flavobacterium sp. NKUCC04_CG]MBW3519587.1 DNA recombination protein RmuC [Flavobacterium sp. NKUCC04_CG]